jgi:aspartate aminotransferase
MRMIGAADDNAFAEFLINEAGVAVVPGSGFGAPGHIRLSFACSAETLKDALARMQRALSGAVARKRA